MVNLTKVWMPIWLPFQRFTQYLLDIVVKSLQFSAGLTATGVHEASVHLISSLRSVYYWMNQKLKKKKATYQSPGGQQSSILSDWKPLYDITQLACWPFLWK